MFCDGLDADVLDEGRVIQRVDAAREDELLPDEDAVAVAQIVEAFLFVQAAAPDAQHVLVRFDGRADQALEVRVADARREGIGRDPVRALGEDRHAVDDELPRLAPLIRLLAQLDGAQADLVRGRLLQRRWPRRDRLTSTVYSGWLAVAVGPPQLRVGDGDAHGHRLPLVRPCAGFWTPCRPARSRAAWRSAAHRSSCSTVTSA